MRFGRKLKALRVLNEMSQKEAGQKLNISQSVYSRYENNDKRISREDPLLERIESLFKVSREWLLYEKDISSGNGNDEEISNEILKDLLKDFLATLSHHQQMTERIINILSKAK